MIFPQWDWLLLNALSLNPLWSRLVSHMILVSHFVKSGWGILHSFPWGKEESAEIQRELWRWRLAFDCQVWVHILGVRSLVRAGLPTRVPAAPYPPHTHKTKGKWVPGLRRREVWRGVRNVQILKCLRDGPASWCLQPDRALREGMRGREARSVQEL